MNGDRDICPRCGDPVDGPLGFITEGNVDTACSLPHNNGGAPKGAPQIGDQDDLATRQHTLPGTGQQRTDQLRLGSEFPAPLVRREDPTTSRSAADAVHRSGGVQRRSVLAFFQIHGRGTSEEAAEHLGIGTDSVRSRISELAALNLLEDTGRTAMSTRGRPCTIWQLVA